MTYSDADLVSALQRAAAGGEPLSVKAYDSWRAGRNVPGSARIIQRLGSWNEALAAAGLTTRAGRATYGRTWDEDALLSAVRDYLNADGSTGSYAGYQEWARGHAGRPSGQTLRNVLGGWAEAKRRAT